MYQLVANSDLIRKVSNDTYFGPGTVEYQEYLEWRSVGNQPLPAEELPTLPNYQEFWNILLVSSVYQKILQQAFSSLAVNTCCTLFIAAFIDAKTGNANIPAIQSCIDLLLENCDLNEDDLNELRSMMVDTELDSLFTINE